MTQKNDNNLKTARFLDFAHSVRFARNDGGIFPMPRRIILFISAIFLCLQGFSQAIYPVSVSQFQVKPSVFLSDYAEPGSQNMLATITFNDLNEVSREVYLRLTIESRAVKLVTSPNFRSNPFTLYVSEPLSLRADDFVPYFNTQNLECLGISKAELQRTGQLPEGYYTFSLEVLEFPSGKIVSRKTSVRIKVELKEPPRPTNPKKGDFVKSNLQQVNFQFMHPDPEINAGNTSYVLKLYEIDDSEKQPLLAIANHTAREIFQSDPFKMLRFDYNSAHPLLTSGKRYAYTITASDDLGKPRFKNNGESEIYWFYYGYPVGGHISLTSPSNFAAFNRFNVPTLRWTACDNIISPTQPVAYLCKVVDMEDSQDTFGVMDNFAFAESRTVSQSGRKEFSYTISDRLGHLHNYAWQVVAESEGTEIGRSEVWTFTGPPAIESFFIENHEVVLKNITNLKLDQFSGEGEFKIDKNGRMQKVEFQNLHISYDNGIYTCDSGFILCAAEGFSDMELTPNEFESNRKAVFKADSIRLGTEGLRIKGKVHWNFPLGLKTGKTEIVSASTWIVYTDYQLQGQFFLPEEKRFELLEPAFFKVILDPTSSFIVYDRTWTMDFSGHVEVNENLKAKESAVYKFPFYNFTQLYDNEISYTYKPIEYIRLLQGADIFMQPRKIVLDLSDAQSPAKFSTDKSWKGIYLEEFDLHFASSIDRSEQLKNVQAETLSYQQTEWDSTQAYIIGNGLNLTVSGDFAQENPVRFYTFESDLKNFSLELKSGLFRKGVFSGNMFVPIISENEKFRWLLPLSDDGFSKGYLNEPLNRLSFTFAEDDAESRLNVAVKRIQFKDLDHLNCDLEIEHPYLNTTFTDLSDFRIYGNKEIGFGKSGGILPLTHRKQALYKGFDISLTEIGAGRMCEKYAIGFRADISLGEDVSGGDGAPAMNLYSNAANSHLTEPCEQTVREISTPEIYANQGDFQMSDEGVGEDDGSSIAEEIEAQNAAMREMIALSEAAMNAMDSIVIEIPVEDEEVGALINDSSTNNNAYIEISPLPETDELSITPEFVVNALKVFQMFLDAEDERSRKIDDFIEFVRTVEQDELFDYYTRLRNGTLIKDIVNNQVTKLVTRLSSPITAVCDTAKNFVSRQILNVENIVFAKFDSLLNIGFNALAEGIKPMLEGKPELQKLSIEAIDISKNAIRDEIISAVQTSVDQNIIGTVNIFIDGSIKGNIVGFIDSTLRRTANLLIEGKIKEFKLSSIENDAKGALTRMGEDAKEFFSWKTLKSMMMNTGNDIYREITWSDIQSDIIAQLFDPSSGAITQAITNVAIDKLGDNAGSAVSAAVQNVGMLFSLQNRSKTDPIRVVFSTPVADGEGYIDLDTGDVVYGKVWRGQINATIKKPTEFAAFATYVNGKTSGEDGFKYWFLEFGVDKLSIPLSPLPLYFTGGAGRVYQRMSRETPNSPYVPDRHVNFGAGIRASFVDQSKGGVLALNVDLGLKLMEKDFELNMTGDVNIANKILAKESKIERSLVTGTGAMRYSSVDKSFYANAAVTTNTRPLLCAGGEFNAYITPDDWGLSVGTRENPLQAKLLCRDFIKMGGWFEINKTYLDLGLFQHVYINPKTPWIGPKACKIQAWAEFGYDFGLQTLVYWKPLKIKEAAVWLDVLIGVGINYKTPLNSGSLTLVSINFGGNLLYVSEPESILSGKLYGKVKVLGIGINVEMQAEKNFSEN